ncbi:2,3-diaminopropionate biosynthesis protein SbnB [Cohnella lupini]|uniref:Ornithine cyclodeaminase n=1 Tax=Cohnella lupini TaxID=1294267 RepID=A0A3D9I1C0_9BACL|nr:2,3-diaminopropionate biosynthesis protein SbnB [Cohnella lupini]RED54946.1 ornithine cyclodeaminase [Cohnella lupini]
MIYLNDGHIRELGIDWSALVAEIESTLDLMGTPEVVQPLKPYLRFGNPRNRIIAMLSYVGGKTDVSGIKWIASFPGNTDLGIPRAHSTIILNDPSTGIPIAVINSAMLSELRTAAVSAVMLGRYLALERKHKYRIGLIGWGPIGRRHMDMVHSLFGDKVESVKLFDLKGIDPVKLVGASKENTKIAGSWQDVYGDSDIFFTCTSSASRYIDRPPLPGSLLMNISLREYMPESVSSVKAIVVDNWHEVCRENTDIEQLRDYAGLAEKDTLSLRDIVYGEALSLLASTEPVFFNPMGMAAFDMTLAAYYWRLAVQSGIGISLEDY